MALIEVQVTWGELLKIELDRWEDATGRTITPLFTAVGKVANVQPNTIGNLRKRTDAPTGKQAIYAYLLIAGMGLDPTEFGVDPDWPDAMDRNRQLKVLRGHLSDLGIREFASLAA